MPGDAKSGDELNSLLLSTQHYFPMNYAKQNMDEGDASRRKIFLIVMLAALVPVAGLVYWMTRVPAASGPPRLASALRPGSPEFEQVRQSIVIDFNADNDATEAARPLGDVVMTMRPTVRNFTGRTIDGLELRATVVDLQGQPVQEKTVISIPNQQAALENNRVFQPTIMMEGFRKTDVRANIRIDLTGVRFR